MLSTAVIVGIVLLFLTVPLQYMPKTVLSTIVFLIGVELVDLKGMRKIWHWRRDEFAVATVTAVVVVTLGVEQGVILAIIMSIIVAVRRGHIDSGLRLAVQLHQIDSAGRLVRSATLDGRDFVPGLSELNVLRSSPVGANGFYLSMAVRSSAFPDRRVLVLRLDRDLQVIAKKVVEVVRRLVYKIGIDTLIESAKIAIRGNPKLFFIAVGGGPDFAEVKTRVEQLGIEKNFKLAGFISDRDLPYYYNAADLFILPSKSGEGLPLVALEAMACGLPVVATDVGGIREIMIEGYGKIVPPNNPELLAEATSTMSNDRLAFRKKALRVKIEERYSWNQNVQKLVEIYEELI